MLEHARGEAQTPILLLQGAALPCCREGLAHGLGDILQKTHLRLPQNCAPDRQQPENQRRSSVSANTRQNDLAGIQAVLVTSVFGARELARATSERDLPVYAVGDATAEAARDAGFTRVESARGDASALTALVLDRLDPAKGPLLYAAGRVTSGDFPDPLTEAGFEVRRVELYAARPAAALSPETVDALREGSLDLALFFSPRTAATFVRLIRDAGLADACGRVTALAISPAVADALRPVSWRAVESAASPNQEAMLALTDAWIAAQGMSGAAARPEAPAERAAAAEPEADMASAAAEPAVQPAGVPALEAAREEGREDGRDARGAPGRRSGLAVAALLLALLFGAAAALGGYLLWQEQERLGAQIAGQQQQQRQPVADDPAFKALQQRLADAEGRTEAAATQAAAIADRTAELDRRLAQQSSAAKADSTADAEAVQALRDRFQTLSGHLAELEQTLRNDLQALRGDLQGVTARLSAAEQADARLADRLTADAERSASAMRALEQRVAALAETAEQAAQDKTAALLLAAGQIRAALESGKPFAAPMATLQRLAGGDAAVRQALAGWGDRAAQGIPTLAALRDRFGSIAETVRPPVQVDTGESWLDRVIGRAASVVQLRRVGEDVPGQTTAAILARAEAELNRGDLARAVAEIDTLAPEEKTAFADWLAAARARLAARDGLAALERAAVESTGGG